MSHLSFSPLLLALVTEEKVDVDSDEDQDLDYFETTKTQKIGVVVTEMRRSQRSSSGVSINKIGLLACFTVVCTCWAECSGTDCCDYIQQRARDNNISVSGRYGLSAGRLLGRHEDDYGICLMQSPGSIWPHECPAIVDASLRRES